MLILLNERSIDLEGRCYRQLKQYIYLNKLYSGTWCELFKTQKYKKTITHRNRMLSRYHRTMRRLIPSKGVVKGSYTPVSVLISDRRVVGYLVEIFENN